MFLRGPHPSRIHAFVLQTSGWTATDRALVAMVAVFINGQLCCEYI